MRCLALLLVGAAVVLADDPGDDFARLKKTGSVAYTDRAKVRLPVAERRTKDGEIAWRRVGRRLEVAAGDDGTLRFRLSRAHVKAGEELVALVRWTELAPADALGEEERAQARPVRVGKETLLAVERSVLVRQPWAAAVRDPKTRALVNELRVGVPAGRVRGDRLAVSVLSVVERGPTAEVPPARRRDESGRAPRPAPGASGPGRNLPPASGRSR